MPVIGGSVFDDQGLELPPEGLLEGGMVGEVPPEPFYAEDMSGFGGHYKRKWDPRRYWMFHDLMEGPEDPIPPEPGPERMAWMQEEFKGPPTDAEGIPLNQWDEERNGVPPMRTPRGKVWGHTVDRIPENENHRGADYWYADPSLPEGDNQVPIYGEQSLAYHMLPDAKAGDWHNDYMRDFLKGERDMDYDAMNIGLGLFHGNSGVTQPWSSAPLQNNRFYHDMFSSAFTNPDVKRVSNFKNLMNSGQYVNVGGGGGGGVMSGYDPRRSVKVGQNRKGKAPYWAEDLEPWVQKPLPNQLDKRYRTPFNQQQPR